MASNLLGWNGYLVMSTVSFCICIYIYNYIYIYVLISVHTMAFKAEHERSFLRRVGCTSKTRFFAVPV